MNEKSDPLQRALPFAMAVLLLIVMGASPAYALFGRERAQQPSGADEGAPIAQNIELTVYKGIPYTGAFSVADGAEGEITYTVVTQPRRGELSVEDDAFTYTAYKTGTDTFLYTASDAEGNTSAEASVTLTVRAPRTGVTYADMEGNAAYTDAITLAEAGIFTGACVNNTYFFCPDEEVTRGEFVAMAMASAGLAADEVTMTGFCDDGAIPTWARSYASSALSSGVIYGVSTADGVAFDAASPITLAEAATVLNRILDITDVSVDALDADEAAPVWAQQALANMRSISLLPAAAVQTQPLSDSVTRADAARMLASAMALCDTRETSKTLLNWF